MPTAVLDLDFYYLPPEITRLERYKSALILIRFHGRPVGQALLPVVNDRIEGNELRERLMYGASSAFWEQWLRDYLRYKEEQVKVETES